MSLPIAQPIPITHEAKQNPVLPVIRNATVTVAHFAINQAHVIKCQIGQGAQSVTRSFGIKLRACLLNLADHLPSPDVSPHYTNMYFEDVEAELSDIVTI